MKKKFSSICFLLSGIIFSTISCSKSGSSPGSPALVGKWAMHSTYKTVCIANGDTAGWSSAKFIGNEILFQFSGNAVLKGIQENSFSKYHFNQRDSILEVQPDSTRFLNLCYSYYGLDPNQEPYLQRGNHTPGTLQVSYLQQDSFEVVARYTQSAGHESGDSFIVVRTGFRKEQ